ncbi:MAG: T9SS type B sorting domain-containing protein [Sphingobacteriales bacterium]|nr:MAG: T9SS type B sorting domain-containing protein [Sphingobacteriales bacterium]
MKPAIRYCLLLLLLLLSARARATHIFGADFYYTHIFGNTYKLTLDVYGDCNGGTLPGVKRFTFSGNVDLGDTSSNWQFYFNSQLGTSVAGRSGSIINMVTTQGSMVLEAMLNNTHSGNSSPTYTTVPTPFFSLSTASSFNPGTIDANGDDLSYQLVSGLETDGNWPFTYNNATYIPPYTPTQPLSVNTGSLIFDNTTGQLDFTPKIVQNSLVVYKVKEYRNGVLVGTSMREMTFVVIPGTVNNSPGALINPADVTGGTRRSPYVMAICKGQVGFVLNPTDADGDNITVTTRGVPATANFTITGNGGKAPKCTFAWNTNNVTPGIYVFFVTYTDDGCPVISKRTAAYKVMVLGYPKHAYTLPAEPTCVRKAFYKFTGFSTGDTMKMRLNSGMVTLKNEVSTNGLFSDSIAAGTYNFKFTNFLGCTYDTTITIADPRSAKLAIAFDKPVCNQYNNGTITAAASNSWAPYEYALDGGSFSTNGTFPQLYSGTYVLHLKDGKQCFKDTIIVLDDSIRLHGTDTGMNITCYGLSDGIIQFKGITSVYGGPYVYSLDGVIQPGSVFNNLRPATYIAKVHDAKGCYIQDTFHITQPDTLLANMVATNVQCYQANNGIIASPTTGGTPAYSYSLNNAPFVPTPVFNNLAPGTYTLHVKDVYGCADSASAVITEPGLLSIFNIAVTYPSCTDTSDGKVNILGRGGVPPYTYSAQGRSSTGILDSLKAGPTLVRITDANGCTRDTLVDMRAPSPVGVDVLIKRATCTPLADGMIVLAGRGGMQPYTYAPGNSVFTRNAKYQQYAAGTYHMQVKDDNNCIIDTNITVQDSLFIYPNANVTDISCYGNKDGSIALAPNGGVAPYLSAFQQPEAYSTSMLYTGNAWGVYHLWAKDALGCIGDTSITITQPEPLLADTANVVYNNCYANTLLGKIAIDVKGGTRPYTYAWSHGVTGRDSMLAGLSNGSYAVRISDAHNCAATVQVSLDYKDCCTPFAPTAFTPNGDGKNDVFHVVAKGDMQVKELQVFNRFGQRVFVGNDITAAWDGSFNGQPAETGTYFYTLKATCGNGNERPVTMSGDVTLIR